MIKSAYSFSEGASGSWQYLLHKSFSRGAEIMLNLLVWIFLDYKIFNAKRQPKKQTRAKEKQEIFPLLSLLCAFACFFGSFCSSRDREFS
jgi:hypothetical protein